VVQSLKSGERRQLTEGSSPRYVSTGHIVFARGPAILALPFDIRTLMPTGPAVPVIDGVVTNYSTGAGAAQLALSNSGTLAYLARGADEGALVWADRKGQMEEIAAPPRPYVEVAMAPSGDRAAVNVESGTDLDIWSYEFERGTLTRLTFGGNNEEPAW